MNSDFLFVNNSLYDSHKGFSEMSTDCEPSYAILARIGEMYTEAKNGIEKNLQEASDLFTEAAELAMQYGKGRLANKYYQYAENSLASL
jgi:hypothetical protein